MARRHRIASRRRWPALVRRCPGVHGAGRRSRSPGSDSYDELYPAVPRAARRDAAPPRRRTTASIAWMAGLTPDRRAPGQRPRDHSRRREHRGVGHGRLGARQEQHGQRRRAETVRRSRRSSRTGSIRRNLVSTTSETKFKGGGTTTRTGELTATMTRACRRGAAQRRPRARGRARDRHQRRPSDRRADRRRGAQDIRRNNQVLSTQVGQFRIRYFGRGLMKDNLKPGWFVRSSTRSSRTGPQRTGRDDGTGHARHRRCSAIERLALSRRTVRRMRESDGHAMSRIFGADGGRGRGRRPGMPDGVSVRVKDVARLEGVAHAAHRLRPRGRPQQDRRPPPDALLGADAGEHARAVRRGGAGDRDDQDRERRGRDRDRRDARRSRGSAARLDVTVSSVGDARSLQGGTLLATPLRGPDGTVRALAQGPLTLGGFGGGQRRQHRCRSTT